MTFHKFRLLRGLGFALIVFFVFASQARLLGKEMQRPKLRIDMTGSDVLCLQDCLKEQGYLHGAVDGYFGPDTLAAVKALQKDQGLAVDGIVGRATWDIIVELESKNQRIYVVEQGETLWAIAQKLGTTVSELADENKIPNPNRISIGTSLVVPPSGRTGTKMGVSMMQWQEVNKLFPKGAAVSVIDVKSGARFRVKRLFGTNHADCEPLTKHDTDTIRRFQGGKWSWNRRPIIVEIGEYRIAASMNGYPHGRSTIDNGFPGHFCIHFLGSRLHSGNKVDKEHQEAVRQAAYYEGR
ncbi:MAG: LysM peptidoglycan-binding domain-containing protein [Firmicutes bacterium]|nr:LysM peptidoglycan-binding domain-containing protein [Bacillota bacterium]